MVSDLPIFYVCQHVEDAWSKAAEQRTFTNKMGMRPSRSHFRKEYASPHPNRLPQEREKQ